MTQWISVNDDSPEVGQQVIVARENGDVTTASYEMHRQEETFYPIWIEHDWLLTDVLYWQPLPDHPEVLENERKSNTGVWDGYTDFGFLNPDEYYD